MPVSVRRAESSVCCRVELTRVNAPLSYANTVSRLVEARPVPEIRIQKCDWFGCWSVESLRLLLPGSGYYTFYVKGV
jgi:hypothetical protein